MTKQYHNGPIEDHKRGCTDIICCVVFVALLVAMLIIGIYSWSSSSFSKLTTPYDSDGKGCGVDYPDYPLIYFVSPSSQSLYRTVCVKKCPSANDSSLQCQPNSNVTTCNKVQSADNNQRVSIYDSTPLRNTVCIPTSDTVKAQIMQAVGDETWQSRVQSLSKVWPILLAAIPIAIVLSVVFMLFIRLTAQCFVYILLALAVAACIGLGVYLLLSSNGTVSGFAINKVFAMVLGALLIAFGVLLTIGLLCFRKRIRLASIIVQASARFVKENCLISFLPFLLFIFLALFIALWILEALGIYSMGQASHQKNQLPFQYFQPTTFVKVSMIFHLFQLFWVVCFLVETGDFLISGAAASWYFQRQSPFAESFKRYSRYHIGSVAFGSFLMALFAFIKFLYELLTPEKADEQGCMASWKKFCDCCCFLCISYIFNCFNSGAYTFIHISGQNYCTSAFQVLGMKVKQPVATAVVSFMSVLFSILIRVGITALTVLVCYLILKNAAPYSTQVPDTTLANVIIGLVGFAISSFFVSLYSEAMEGIYTCYVVDKDAGGAEDKAPKELLEFLQEAKRQGQILVE